MSGLGCLPLPRQRPSPPSSCAERALTGLGGRSGPRPGDPIPGQAVPSINSSGMTWAPVRVEGCGSRGERRGERQPSLLQVTIEDVKLRVGVVEA